MPLASTAMLHRPLQQRASVSAHGQVWGCNADRPKAKSRHVVPLPLGSPSAPRLNFSTRALITPPLGEAALPAQADASQDHPPSLSLTLCLPLDADPLAEGPTASEPQAVWQPRTRPQTEAVTTLSFWDVPTHLCTQLTWLLAGFLTLANWCLASREPCSHLHQGSRPGCQGTSEPHLYCLHTLPIE